MIPEKMQFYVEIIKKDLRSWLLIVSSLQREKPNTCAWCGKKTTDSRVFCTETIEIEGLAFRKRFVTNECAYNWLEAHKDLILEMVTK
jgi:hypothetical protein